MEPGEELLLPFLRSRTDAALRKPLEAAIKRAGLKQWDKLWHNLRASRQTELESAYPTHVVCAWLGNSPAIAHKHYLQVTDDHYRQAAHNPAHHASTSGDTSENEATEQRPPASEKPTHGGLCSPVGCG